MSAKKFKIGDLVYYIDSNTGMKRYCTIVRIDTDGYIKGNWFGNIKDAIKPENHFDDGQMPVNRCFHNKMDWEAFLQ